MAGNLRKEAIDIFKKLHRTRLKTFQGDEKALQLARQRINDEFRKNKHVSNEESIKELIKLATEVEIEVRKTVIQIVEKTPGIFEARITPDNLVDNASYGQIVDKSQFKNWKKCTDIQKKA